MAEKPKSKPSKAFGGKKAAPFQVKKPAKTSKPAPKKK
jgi:hypothetical protein